MVLNYYSLEVCSEVGLYEIFIYDLARVSVKDIIYAL